MNFLVTLRPLLLLWIFIFFANLIYSQSNQWTWEKGDSIIYELGVYFPIGTTSALIKPGGRKNSSSWTDKLGNKWLFGGNGQALDGSLGELNDLWKYSSSTNEWTWMKGDYIVNRFGKYGTQTLSSAVNKPGARDNSVSWSDSSGNMWLFGGHGFAGGQQGDLNDLWKYNSTTNEWTWIKGDSIADVAGNYGTKGVPSFFNKPGARQGSIRWTDASGNLWLFGGYGLSGGTKGNLNDLWKFNTVTSEWVWVKGDSVTFASGTYGALNVPSLSNKPGARDGSIGWTDSFGNLWLFGGSAYFGGFQRDLNDLWKYSPDTNEWTWISGDSTLDAKGVYGTKGIQSPTNKPGAREGSVGWIDSFNNLWLFGGYEFFGFANLGKLNDVWKYNITSNQWTWMKGENTPNTLGVYGQLRSSSSSNNPGGRDYSISWSDPSGNFWLFGGSGFALNYFGNLNDMWKYMINTNEWVWVKGDSTKDISGVYGVPGTASLNNKPGARESGIKWTDRSGNLWLFGGYGNAAAGSGYLNDLWKYNPSSNEWLWINGDVTTYSKSSFGIKGVSSLTNKPGGRKSGVSWTDTSGNLWLFGGYGVTYQGFSEMNDLWRYNIAANEWTWIKGDSTAKATGVYGTQGISSPINKPGAREHSTGWVGASGDLWLFGGGGYASGDTSFVLNDLWKYNISTNKWTWINGSNTVNPIYLSSVYGNQGTSSTSNKPGGRFGGVGWTDVAGNMWLFSGNGYAANGRFGYLNDLWKYNPSNNKWTWVKGDTINYIAGVYGTKGMPSINNKPGARIYSVSWTDLSGNFWLYGGGLYDGSNGGLLNDLWKYNVFSNEWTWIKGSNTINTKGVYGIPGSATASNNPGARESSVSWTDASGNLWLFGGAGFDAVGGLNDLNDLWKYTPNTTLSVTVTSFTGSLQNDKITLKWVSQNELNYDKFEVEKSLNGSVYTKIGEVKATNAASYNFSDDAGDFRGRKVYYRLKEIDKDGVFKYSSVVALQIPFNAKFAVFPNPATTILKLKIDENIRGRINVKICDVSGMMIVEKVFDANGSIITIPVNKLLPGTYLVKMIYKNERYLQKVVVVK